MNCKRLFVAVLVMAIMTSAVWAGAQRETAATAPQVAVNRTGYPIVDQRITMSVVVERQAVGAPEEGKWFWPFAEEYFGIRFEPQQIDAALRQEQKSIMFATGEVPDLFLHVHFDNAEIIEYGVNQKFFVPLGELVAEWAPNIQRTFAEYPELLGRITTPDGKYYTLPGIRSVNFLAAQRAFINTKWLENLGLGMPTTLDEFHSALKAFKDRDPNRTGRQDTIPFGGSWSEGFSEEAIIISAFGFIAHNARGMGLTLDSDEAVFIPYHPLFREYLAYMNRLWRDGLMDPDMFTQTDTQARAKSAQNIVGFQMDGAPFVITANAWLDWEAARPLSSPRSSTPVHLQSDTITSSRFFMTVRNQHREASIRFADWFFTTEAYNLFWVGPPIGSPEAEMGNLQYGHRLDSQGYRENVFAPGTSDNWNTVNTVLSPISGFPLGVIPPTAESNAFRLKRWGQRVAPVVPPRTMEAYEVEEPDRGLLARLSAADRERVLASYEKDGILYRIRTDLTEAQISSLGDMFRANDLVVTLIDGSEAFLISKEPWWRYSKNQNTDPYAKHGFPQVFLTAEQVTRTRELATPISDLVTQMTARFITGVEPLANFDSYRQQLHRLGVEEYERIFADAYEVYKASIE